VSGAAPVAHAVTGTSPSTAVVTGRLPLGGVVINNFTALYTADRFAPYNMTTGIAYGLNACIPTGNALNAGPVWRRFSEDERDYINLAHWGVNYVKFGVDWHWWAGSDPTTAQAQAAFAVMEQHIAWNKTYGIYVSIVMDV